METIQVASVKLAIARVKRALREAEAALAAHDAVECRNALERAQHRAFEAKALFQGEALPADEAGA